VLLLWDFEPFTALEPMAGGSPSPDAFHSLGVHRPAFMAKQGGDPAIAVSTVLLRQMYDVCSESRFVHSRTTRLSVSGTMLTRNPAGAALRYTEHLLHMVHGQTTTRRA